MATFTTFEDILAWQKARTLTGRIYAATSEGTPARDFGLCDQLRRASASVMANIAEGFERRSRKEFAQFLGIARGSAGEVRSHLYVALDAGHLDREVFEELARLPREITYMLNALIRHLEASPRRAG